MRSPTPAEVTALRMALADEMGGSLDWEPTWENVGIIEAYMPDGPSWTGKAAIFPGGEICYINLAIFDTSGRVVKSLQTMEFVS